MIKKEILDYIKNNKNEWIKLRHYLHQHPENALNEFNTTNMIKKFLENNGFELKEYSQTGIVGVLKNGNSNNKIGIRVAIDAVLQKENNKSIAYYSLGKNMHCNGNDGHIAMLLGVCQYLAKSRNFDGTFYAIFQPAQSVGKGSIEMINNNFFNENLNKIYSIQNLSDKELPQGEIGDLYFYEKDKSILPSEDIFEYKIFNSFDTNNLFDESINPIIIASNIITNIYNIINTKLNPYEKVFLSIVSFNYDSKASLSDNHCLVKFSLKCFDEESRKKALYIIDDVFLKYSQLYSCNYEKNIIGEIPMLKNNIDVVKETKEIARTVFGNNKIKQLHKIFISDDFGNFLEKIPGCMIFINNGDSNKLSSNNYDFNDTLIYYGVALFVSLIEKNMPFN